MGGDLSFEIVLVRTCRFDITFLNDRIKGFCGISGIFKKGSQFRISSFGCFIEILFQLFCCLYCRGFCLVALIGLHGPGRFFLRFNNTAYLYKGIVQRLSDP